MLSKRTEILLLFALVLLAGCSAALYIPQPGDATADSSLEELTLGRELYVERCGRCHALYLPDRFSVAQWSSSLDRMQPRARIDDTEKALILKMLAAGKARTAAKEQ